VLFYLVRKVSKGVHNIGSTHFRARQYDQFVSKRTMRDWRNELSSTSSHLTVPTRFLLFVLLIRFVEGQPVVAKSASGARARIFNNKSGRDAEYFFSLLHALIKLDFYLFVFHGSLLEFLPVQKQVGHSSVLPVTTITVPSFTSSFSAFGADNLAVFLNVAELCVRHRRLRCGEQSVHAVPHTLHMILGRRSALQLQTDKEILKLYQSEKR